MPTHRRALLLRLAVLAAMWMATLGILMAAYGPLLDGSWNVVPTVFGTGSAILAGVIALDQLLV